MWQAPCLPAPEADTGTYDGALLQITTTSQSGPGQKNIISNMSKAIHSSAYLIGIGDIDRAPVNRTFVYVLQKIILIDENFKSCSLFFEDITIPDCFLKLEYKVFAVNFYHRA